jgi:2-(1,2-epoxy-1,2-dihydrophenyl)acetyl-CoA isomerase
MAYSKVEYELVDQVAFVRLNDPDTLNAMSTTLGRELLDAVRRAGGEARALLIGSVGRAFSSGANLNEMDSPMKDPERDVGALLETIYNPLILEMRASKIPIVTAVRGPAAGVSCGIALAGDIIVAGEGAYFFQAFRHIGLVPDGGSAYLLAKSIGRVRAMEMMLLGTKLHAPKALEWGLINRVVPDDQVDETALAIARELAQGPSALGAIKESAWMALELPLEESLALERERQRSAGRSEDFVEGVAAFREKRPASFKGR